MKIENQWPIISKLGLNIFKSKLDVDNSTWHVVAANDLESLLASAQRVYGWGKGADWHPHQTSYNKELSDKTHTALLVGVEEIRKGVTREQILGHLREAGPACREALAERIEAEGIID